MELGKKRPKTSSGKSGGKIRNGDMNKSSFEQREDFGKLNDQRQQLLKKIGLEFSVFGELAVGYADVEKYITLFLSPTGTKVLLVFHTIT